MSLNDLRKLYRFSKVYGVTRASNKAFGRIRNKFLTKLYFRRLKRSVGIIGCGQFSFSTICFFVSREYGNVFLSAYDIDAEAQRSLTRYYRFLDEPESSEELLSTEGLERLFIVSNHASHTEYAVKAMQAGIRLIHIEKPISTTYEQFLLLVKTKQEYGVILYAGYNRPYSAAVRKLSELVKKDGTDGGFSLNCFVSGHLIDENHWYRRPEEGTRICGNMGHWLDLAVHVLSWRKLPDIFKIQITYADTETPDDNIIINISTELGDIISLTLTARSEPFEGINETINFQHGDVIAKVDDFRAMTVWQNEKLSQYTYFPKDVGHRLAATQLFRGDAENRAWEEVVISTLLMLFITDMVRSKEYRSTFVVPEAQENLKKNLNDLSLSVTK